MIKKPNSGNGWVDKYVALVPEESLIEGLKRQTQESLVLLSSLSDEQLNFRYAEGKWTIKEIILHLVDTERIFTYRALAFARKDPNALPGFDENIYAANSHANDRDIKNLLEEYIVVRTCTVATFSGFPESALECRGTANNIDMCVAALGFAICGHEIHHINIIQERYLTIRSN